MGIKRRMAFAVEADEGAGNEWVRLEAHLESNGMGFLAIE